MHIKKWNFFSYIIIAIVNSLLLANTGWSSAKIPQYEPVLHASSCMGNGPHAFCVAAGIDIIYQSKNGAENWTKATIINPPTVNFTMESANCTEKNGTSLCIVAGNLQSGSVLDLSPLLILTRDKGKTWHSADLAKLPKNGQFYSVSCTDEGESAFCIAVGDTAYSHSDSYPIVAQSTDGGKTWFDASPKDIAGSLYAASCADKRKQAKCYAVGRNNGHPFIIQSTNRGKDWHLRNLDSLPYYSFYDISCVSRHAKTFCAAAGTDGLTPLIVQSDDAGKTWSQPTIQAIIGHNNLHSIFCSQVKNEIVCLAGGYTSPNLLLLVQTHDSGKNWIKAPIRYPLHNGGGPYHTDTIRSISCATAGKPQLCTAVTTFTGNWYAVYVLQSQDGGERWQVLDHPGLTSVFSTSCFNDKKGLPRCIAVGTYDMDSHIIYTKDGGTSWQDAIIN